MKPFWALRVHAPEGNPKDEPFSTLEQIDLKHLSQGEVVIEVHYSSVNYKDALAATGKGKILRRYPLVAGIDASGVVIESTDSRFKTGDKVIVTGCGIGESVDGGYSEVLRVSADSVVPLPAGLTLREAMILGTAGFTTALAYHRMLENHQTPAMGPILVTGASGGVGCFAVQLFSQQGYSVVAASGKHAAISLLKKLGAEQVIPPAELLMGERSLETVRFGGVIDNVGGHLLGQALAHTQLWGNVCSIGLAESPELNTSVMPFILRGVSLLGVSSNNCTREVRHNLWQKLATNWKPPHLESICTRTVGLKDLMLACEDLMHRRVMGRILVEIRKDA